MSSLREKCLKLIQNDTFVERFQKYFGIVMGEKGSYIITNRFWYYLFLAGASLGNELFYLTFIPFLIWNDLPFRTLKTILAWLAAMFIGQSLKDLWRLPRPTSPMIARLELHYAEEYGAPSTHAMVAINMPVYFSYLICQDTSDPVVAYGSILIAFLWAVVMILSRFYVGVHSPLDILVGIGLGFAILTLNILYLDGLMEWVIHQPFSTACVVVVSLAAFLIYIYPMKMNEKWTNAYGDTTLIVSSSLSCLLSVCYLVSIDQMEMIHFNKTKHLTTILIKTFTGFFTLLLVRTVFKAIAQFIFVRLASPSGEQPGKRYSVEIPTKIVTYSMIGLFAFYVLPVFFYYQNWK